MMAGACRAGVSWNAWLPISMPIYSRIGRIATTGISELISDSTPKQHSSSISTPVAAE
jgi:hypothetical protein